MEELEQLQERLHNQRPIPWEKFPDIPLYMDQVLYYINHQLDPICQPELLTAAMVNNYTKSGLLPRAEGTRYNSDHLAYLTTICILKQVLPARDIDLLIRKHLQDGDIRNRYEVLMESLDQTLNRAADEMQDYMTEDKLEDAAVHFALNAFAASVVCRRYVDILRQNHPELAPGKERNR